MPFRRILSLGTEPRSVARGFRGYWAWIGKPGKKIETGKKLLFE
jgi:hypothetical protein